MKYPGSLHNHTDFSNLTLRDSTNTIEGLVDYAVELGYKVLAFTEHETVAGFIKVEEKAEEVKDKIKIIRGNEIYLTRNDLTKETYDSKNDRYYHFILLAIDEIGNQQIRELSQRAWLRGWKTGFAYRRPTYYRDLEEVIGANPGHVIGSTACLGGWLDTMIVRESETPLAEEKETLQHNIRQWISNMVHLFGRDYFYLELQPSKTIEQEYANAQLVKLGKELNVPWIITTDAHYRKKEDRIVHKTYLKAQNGEREVDEFYSATYLQSDEEVRGYLKDIISDEDIEAGYESIMKIADMCQDYSIKNPLKIPELEWKEPTHSAAEIDAKYNEIKDRVPELENFINSSEKSDKLLGKLLIERFIDNPEEFENKETYDELNECLKDTRISSEINNAHWSAYYLNLMKIIDGIWDAGSYVGCGRGSGVGFIILYMLGITQINPLREETPTYRWRFLNPDRVSVMDVDIDCEAARRQNVLNKFRQLYGEDRVANVMTLRTETTKSAILTAARGLGIDVDDATYLTGMIQADRGQTRSLRQTYYGDESKGMSPNRQFVAEMNKRPELWKVAKSIENLICGFGTHAGGVVFKDEPFVNSIALMRSPAGEIQTQFELHDLEKAGDIKYDVLSVDALDKIHNTIDLLIADGLIEEKPTLKETYESVVGIYNLERKDPKMWELIWEHRINALFQMEKQSGIQGIGLIHPVSVKELSTLNSVIRLMAQEKGEKTPLEKWAIYRDDINIWYQEMREYGLSPENIRWLANHKNIVDGLCIQQEDLMQLTMEPELGGNSLGFADKARKVIGKKQVNKIDGLREEFYNNAKEAGCDMILVDYVWNVLFKTQLGYSFNSSHTLAYSLIGLQEMNLAFRYPIIYWNTGCLISDAGVNQTDEEIEREDVEGKKAQTRYGKMAAAIGRFQSSGIKIAPPNINTSSYTFTPDVENNEISFGLRGITRISDDIINIIMSNRPYKSFDDFKARVKVNKTQMYSLIKSGCFDCFENREKLLERYTEMIADTKENLDMRNALSLVRRHVLDGFGLDFQCAVVLFDSYLKKKQFKNGNNRLLDEKAFGFWERNLDMDKLIPFESEVGDWAVNGEVWRKYKVELLAPMKNFIKVHKTDLLMKLNADVLDEVEEKYGQGSVSRWEMDSLSCYIHEHEMVNVSYYNYELSDFSKLPDDPEIEKVLTINGKRIPIFKIRRIAGTVLDRDKLKNNVTLLTREGVVTVKIYGDAFSKYDRQISEKLPDGKKKVIEKSWFSRGSMIIVTGIKRDSMFFAKKYKSTPYHLVEKIESIDENGLLHTITERKGTGLDEVE